MSAFIYNLDVLHSTSDVLCACYCFKSSRWCLIWSSGVLTITASYIERRLYLSMFLFRVRLLTLMYVNS